MPRPLAPAVRDRILTLLAEGQSCRAIARAVGCSISTVSVLAAAEGFSFERSQTKKAAAAVRDYAHAERLDLLNELFGVARTMAPTVETPAQLQTLATAVAILIDKRRLEDGEATARTETHDSGTARQLVAGRLDELAARRGAHRDTG